MPHIAETVLEAAGIGGWELEVAIGRLTWTAITFQIYDMDPPHAPPLADALNFYPPEARPMVDAAVRKAIDTGTKWDIEAPLVTARGRHRWVRSWGLAVREDGRTVRLVGAVQDVTDRRAAEDAARAQAAERERAELLLRDVLETLPIGVSVFDADDRFVLINRAYREMFPTMASLFAVGRKLEALMRLGVEHGQYAGVPADEAGREAWIARHMEFFRSPNGVARQLEMPDGRVMQVRERRSENGTLVSVRVDTTELHAAEATAQRAAAERGRAEALLQDVLDALPSAITAYDSDDRLVMCNRRFAEMFPIAARFAVPGRAHAEIVRLAEAAGQYADAPAEPAARDAWIAQLLGFFRDGSTHELRLPGGRVAELRESRSRTGNRVTVRTDITDLTLARARASSEAAERARADALLRDVVATVPSAIVAYDRDECLILTNPADSKRQSLPPALSALGQRLEDVMRLAVSLGLFLGVPAAPAAHEAWFAEFMAFLRHSGGAPRTLRLSDGRSIQVRASRSVNGNLVIIRTDITDLMRTQALLHDVLEAMPSAVVAYDRDERVVLANQSLGEMAPMLTGVTDAAMRLAEVLRVAADGGYFADLPAAAADQDVWLAELLEFFRHDGGMPRTLRVSEGRSVQVRARRSATGNLVVVSTDITTLIRAQALLRDVMDALPNAVIAYDSDEHVILFNRAHVEMAPSAASFIVAGGMLEDAVRQAAALDYFADAPADPAAREAWLSHYMSYLRDSGGKPRTTHLANGHAVQVRTLRSQTGNLVIVRTDITDLLAAQALLRDVMDALPSAVVAFDRDERIVLANRANADLGPPGLSFTDSGKRLEDAVRLAVGHGYFADTPSAPDAREAWLASYLSHLRASGGKPRTMRLSNGHIVQVRTLRSETGNLVVVRNDITELLAVQAMLRDVMDALPSAVIAYDRDEKLVLWNRAAAELLPEAAAFAVAGRTLEEMVRFSTASGAYLDVGAAAPDGQDGWVPEILAAYRAGSGVRTVRMRDGRFLTALERRSESGNLVCVRTDTTDLKRAEQHLRWQAERDPLTKLHNRNFFVTALDQALAAAAAGGPNGGVLLMLDIDYFKQINDTLGHDMGDALLVEIATRLRLYLRDGGEGAARLGGDEFGVVIPGLTDAAAVMARVDALHAVLSAPADLGGRRTPVDISMGATMFPADGTDAAKLLKNADLALYEAKRNGRGRWAQFRPAQATALARHVRMADALREALSRHMLTVALQPKRLLRDGAHAGFEALARWHDGTGWVAPSAFIPVAEEAGLIRPLGRAVMAAALARLREVRDRGLAPGRVAVNVTGPQLLDPHFREQTLAALRLHGLLPADLELELTGTALFGRSAERIEPVLRTMSDLGIRVALDNFGTGGASLVHLSRLPIDSLKIDRSFVDGIGSAGPGRVITRTVISLARSLGMESVAKGVETAAQMAFLADAGCDVAQGYLVSRPLLTTDEAAAYLSARVAPELPL